MDPDSSGPSRRRRYGAAGPPSRGRRYGTAGLRVSVTDSRGRPVRDGGLTRWLASVAPRGARGELAIALVPDARMRILNRSYRRSDYATDVLSFASEGFPHSSHPSAPRTTHSAPRAAHRPSRFLGDIVIATGVAARQAREAGHSYQTELRVLALHGLLHLLGYDHENRSDDGRMARAEARLRKKGGLQAGLIARAAAGSAAVGKAAAGRGRL